MFDNVCVCGQAFDARNAAYDDAGIQYCSRSCVKEYGHNLPKDGKPSVYMALYNWIHSTLEQVEGDELVNIYKLDKDFTIEVPVHYHRIIVSYGVHTVAILFDEKE